MKTDNTYSDYWLEDIEEFNGSEGSENSLDLDMIRLASARRAIGNFVQILTNKPIPVLFNNKEANLTDGKTVFIGSEIADKEDFDPAVGLALHEGSHILLSDFDLLKTLWGKIPKEIYDITDPKNISKETVLDTVKFIWNIIEDRYIDNFVYKNAPGYRGYYIALYNKYFNSNKIDDMLKSNMYRKPSIDAYTSRICNFMNINTDLNALPDLRHIAQLIDLKNINRLNKPIDRFELAFEVSKVIFKNAGNPEVKQDSSLDMDGNDVNKSDNQGSQTSNEKKETDDVLGGEKVDNSCTNSNPVPSNEDKIKSDEGDKSEFSDNKVNQIKKAIEKQKNFLNGDLKKKNVTSYQKTMLEAIEKSGMTIERVGKDLYDNKDFNGIDCIVVKNMTKELVLSDEFPMSYKTFNNEPNIAMKNAVSKGIIMGNKLGNRLLLRNETNVTKFMRKSDGKIDKRTIAELGFNNDRVFYSNKCDKYNETFIHISVDASSSMEGIKWHETISSVVAICKACSMVENINVSVSFRTTITTKRGSYNPYIVIGYDSSKDKFSKIVNLFPYLNPNGTTPEGLAFEATLNCFKEKITEKDCYFLNFSDGEPYMSFSNDNMNCCYTGEIAIKHTRRNVYKIKEKGYNVLSYYINENYYNDKNHNINNQTYTNFRQMYGKDASFINTNNINMISKTLNELFLKKD